MKNTPIKVDYVDHMGTDLTVVNAARVSFDKRSSWDVRCWVCGGLMENSDLCPHCEEDNSGGDPAESRALPAADVKLIAYLAKHNHWSPFAHTSIQLRIKAPIFVARQLVKHQVGGVWNEVSRRYVDSEPEFYFPEVWRGRPTDGAKQGSSGQVDLQSVKQKHLYSFVPPAQAAQQSLLCYNQMLAAGVAPEQARMILPQNLLTEWYWTGSLMFFARVCAQRLDPHAQAETSDVARQIADIVRPLFPVSWLALTGKEAV